MTFCDRCGGDRATGDHAACEAARALEPPRFCPVCRRRMKVQVLPAGWSAVCVEHGETRTWPRGSGSASDQGGDRPAGTTGPALA